MENLPACFGLARIGHLQALAIIGDDSEEVGSRLSPLAGPQRLQQTSQERGDAKQFENRAGPTQTSRSGSPAVIPSQKNQSEQQRQRNEVIPILPGKNEGGKKRRHRRLVPLTQPFVITAHKFRERPRHGIPVDGHQRFLGLPSGQLFLYATLQLRHRASDLRADQVPLRFRGVPFHLSANRASAFADRRKFGTQFWFLQHFFHVAHAVGPLSIIFSQQRTVGRWTAPTAI